MTADEILRIHKEVFYGALKNQKYAALEELYSDAYMLVRPDGSVLNKKGGLARSSDERVDVFDSLQCMCARASQSGLCIFKALRSPIKSAAVPAGSLEIHVDYHLKQFAA